MTTDKRKPHPVQAAATSSVDAPKVYEAPDRFGFYDVYADDFLVSDDELDDIEASCNVATGDHP